MKCPRCNMENIPGDLTCKGCGALLPEERSNQYREVKTFFVPAILVTIFCCIPFGIPAIVFASQAKSLVEQGKYMEAEEKASKAKTFVIISVILGIIGGIISVVANLRNY